MVEIVIKRLGYLAGYFPLCGVDGNRQLKSE
jgi:hypothetical protein